MQTNHFIQDELYATNFIWDYSFTFDKAFYLDTRNNITLSFLHRVHFLFHLLFLFKNVEISVKFFLFNLEGKIGMFHYIACILLFRKFLLTEICLCLASFHFPRNQLKNYRNTQPWYINLYKFKILLVIEVNFLCKKMVLIFWSKFPVYGKMNIPISCFSCAVAILGKPCR